jgi:NADH-quinone oxidoreductase subunit G
VSENDKPTGEGGKGTSGGPTGTTSAGGNAPAHPPALPTNVAPRAGHEAQPPAKPPAPPSGPPPKPQPKNPGFITCVIDGREIVVKPGTNMIEAAKLAGSDIPYYCYHPRLSIAANCRMCLVEASNAPKLVPACQTPLVEGQVVKTASAKVKDQQRATLEFILLNHPVDCAICDQAGECKLQDYYVKYDYKASRLEGPKVLKNKRKVLGPLVVLDQERCILCTRCVRFMDEVAKEPQLGVFGRGSHERIDTFPGAELSSNYSVNTVDICPVGALLNRDFRFRARAWFLSTAPSVCTGCSRGCSTFVDFFGQDTYRYRPRENEQINKSWMCDQGRLSYKYLNKGRLTTATLGRGADAREVEASEAVSWVAGKLKPLLGEAGLAFLASPLASNEELLASLQMAKEVLGLASVYVGGRPPGQADHFLMTADKNPNRKGLELAAAGLGLSLRSFDELLSDIEGGKVKALYAVGAEVPDEARFVQAAGRLEVFIAQAYNESAVTKLTDALLPASVHTEQEGTFVQQDGIIQRFRQAYPPRGGSLPHFRWTSLLSNKLGFATDYPTAQSAWASLSSTVAAFASFDWNKSAPPVRLARGTLPLPASADGRPPGYREFGAPRVRGI